MSQYITIEPNECLADQDVKICIYGLQVNQNVTICAGLGTSDIGNFESFANYTADDNGMIDLSSHASLGGSYAGVESMGLFWSMKPSPNNKKDQVRLTVRDVEKPIEVRIRVFDGHLNYEELNEFICKLLVEGSVKQWYKRSDVRRIPVRWKRVRGTLFVPQGVGPFPAVLDLHGAAGGLTEHRASLLASRGYVCLALAYFGFEDLPTSCNEIDLGYFEEARDFLQTLRETNKGQIGLVGSSLGGTLALACATYIAGFACAVLITAPVFTFLGAIRYHSRLWPAKSTNPNMIYEMDGEISAKYVLDEYYNVESSGDSLIEFAQSNKPFLFIFSHDDEALNTPKSVSFIKSLLKDSKVANKIVTYPMAGHEIQPPHTPHTGATYLKRYKIYQKWGGSPKMHCKAQELAWAEILMFLKNNLAMVNSKL